MKIDARRVTLAVLKTLLFALALLYLADYFGWSLFTEAGGRTRATATQANVRAQDRLQHDSDRDQQLHERLG